MKVIQGQNHSFKQGLNCKTNHEPSYQEKYWLRISAGQNVCIQPICLTPFLGFKVVSLNKINLKVGGTHFYRGCQFIPSIFFLHQGSPSSISTLNLSMTGNLLVSIIVDTDNRMHPLYTCTSTHGFSTGTESLENTALVN